MSRFSVVGQRVVVVGAARSGIAAAELLRSRGAEVVLVDHDARIGDDDRLRQEGIEVERGPHRPETMQGADLIVLSPGVLSDQPAIRAATAAGVPVIGEIELASRWLTGRMVAITGTKGKSTTAVLTGRMLELGGFSTVVGGNIGHALSAQVAMSGADVIHVVEVSSFQLECTDTFRPWIAVLLNLSPDHLDRHPTFEAYASAKRRVFANQEPTDWAVINADDPQALALARAGRARLLRFALDTAIEEGVVATGDVIARRTPSGDEPLMPLSSVRLLGRHQLSDVLAATAVGTLVGVAKDAMRRAVEGFKGIEHALEPVMGIEGVRFINDSKATNLEAARRAVESFPWPVVPILGGRFKGGDFRVLRESLAGRAPGVVVIGEAGALIREGLGEVVPTHQADTMAAAVRTAFGLVGPGGTVLLAPACSSFDMFKDYAERGRVFKQEVERLRADVTSGRER